MVSGITNKKNGWKKKSGVLSLRFGFGFRVFVVRTFYGFRIKQKHI